MNPYIARTNTVEGQGVAIQGHEEDFLEFMTDYPSDGSVYGMSDLLKTVGVDPISWFMLHHFEEEHVKNDWEDLEIRKHENIKEFREQTGEQFPTLYKIRISVEAEELSTEEINKFWLNRQAQCKKLFETMKEGD